MALISIARLIASPSTAKHGAALEPQNTFRDVEVTLPQVLVDINALKLVRVRLVEWHVNPRVPMGASGQRLAAQPALEGVVMSNFDEIELLLSRLLAAATPMLSDSEQAEVQKFIDVGEYGLALETAVDICSEEKKAATAEVVRLIQSLAVAMSMDPGSLMERLPK